MFILSICLLLCTLFIHTMEQQNKLPQSLIQKQLILHARNLNDILFDGLVFPPASPKAFLATIYNITQFFQEPEVASLPQQLPCLYDLINVRNLNNTYVSERYVARCKKTHPTFVAKLVTMHTLKPDTISEQIDKLNHAELKTFLHACVAFYAAQNNAQRIDAENKLAELRNKYPNSIPAIIEETPYTIDQIDGLPIESQPKVRLVKIYSFQ